uniref:ORF3 n=1 Tax=Panagrellus redivivus TaxID=6233 RepID=A0A7E4VCL1_PANRE
MAHMKTLLMAQIQKDLYFPIKVHVFWLMLSKKPSPLPRRGGPSNATQPTAPMSAETFIQEAESSVSPASSDVETDWPQPSAPKRRRRYSC